MQVVVVHLFRGFQCNCVILSWFLSFLRWNLTLIFRNILYFFSQINGRKKKSLMNFAFVGIIVKNMFRKLNLFATLWSFSSRFPENPLLRVAPFFRTKNNKLTLQLESIYRESCHLTPRNLRPSESIFSELWWRNKYGARKFPGGWISASCGAENDRLVWNRFWTYALTSVAK